MWKCQKCGLPVYFAERRQSLGYDWHPNCLRCEECGKILSPGTHAEHKGLPYCHIPCYAALFGPQLFGHGSTTESHRYCVLYCTVCTVLYCTVLTPSHLILLTITGASDGGRTASSENRTF